VRSLRAAAAAPLLPLLLAAASPPLAQPRDGSHDFDFDLGRWTTELWRLKRPLTGSTEWERYSGTTNVTPVWNGRGNLVELEVDGPRGRLQALSLRLYRPDAGEWTLNYSNAAGGTLALPPSVGRFGAGGVGEFFSQETDEGRPVLVRFVIARLGPFAVRFEQSYSPDGGRTWELNWIATDTRSGG
jgi:hypothetical protein